MVIAGILREEIRHTRAVQDWLAEGRQKGKAALTLRQLTRRCGPPAAGRFTPAGLPRLRLGRHRHGKRQLSCLRAEGKLISITHRFEASGAPGQCGICRTRWATHGMPEERNAQPHQGGPGRVAVLQNGIIENDRTLREELQAEGVVFRENGSSQYPADHPQRP